MKNLILPFLVGLTLAGFPLRSMGNGYVIGNGGEGVEIENMLYLRDLVDTGSYLEPFIGPHMDGGLQKSFRGFRFDFSGLPLSQEKLLRKLTDLERAYPSLGYYLLSALRAHTWIAIETPLARTPDFDYWLEPRYPLVQIANRTDFAVRIHRPSWLRMNDEHRIALLFHEAIFSLLRPTCDAFGNDCQQLPRIARNLTGLIFSGPFLRDGLFPVVTNFLPYVDLPSDGPRQLPAVLMWTLRLKTADGEKVLRHETSSLPGFFARREIYAFCDLYSEALEKGDGNSSVIESRLERLPFERKFSVYRVKQQGRIVFLSRLSIVPRAESSEDVLTYSPESNLSCGDFLGAHLSLMQQDL